MNARAERSEDNLAGTEFADLPEAFTPRDPVTGRISGDPTTQPVWLVVEDTFRGRWAQGTRYTEGTELVDFDTPNAAMKPLNKAAARRYVAWRESIPAEGTSIGIDEILEAATRLAGEAKFEVLSKEDKSKAIAKMAGAQRAKRLAEGQMELPPLAHNFSKAAANSTVSPMVGVKYSQVSRDAPLHHPAPAPMVAPR